MALPPPRRRLRTLASSASVALLLVALSAALPARSTAAASNTYTWTQSPPSVTSARAAKVGAYSLSVSAQPAARPAGPLPSLRPVDGAGLMPSGGPASGVPRVPATPLAPSPSLPVNIDAAGSEDSALANNYDDEPPDQGLCVGDGKVVEAVNNVLRVYSTTGAVVTGPTPMSSIMSEPPDINLEFLSDPRCLFDSTSAAFIITELAYDRTGTASHLDIAVMPAAGSTITIYRLDTTDSTASGCPCFSDQPRLGLDVQNVYVASDEFAIRGPAFGGSSIYAVSRSQLESLAAAPQAAVYRHLVDAGLPVLGLQPAITSGSAPAEFFAHSFEITANVHLRPSDNRIGVFAMTHESALSSGGKPRLSAPVVTRTEPYVQPVGAVNPNGFVLNADDDRMQQLQYINGHLWTTLSTAVTIGTSTVEHDGIAWMELSVALANSTPTVSVAAQGRIASRGVDLLYPAITVSPAGSTAIAFSLTSQAINPSVGYLVRPSGVTSWGNILVAATGTGPENGFTCSLGSTCRWGDYSALVVDPGTGQFWGGAQYIPPRSSQADTQGGGATNWGTRLYEFG